MFPQLSIGSEDSLTENATSWKKHKMSQYQDEMRVKESDKHNKEKVPAGERQLIVEPHSRMLDNDLVIRLNNHLSFSRITRHTV